jgi:hypothetical protein
MNEKIEHLKNSGAIFLPPPADARRALDLANAAFQQMRAAVLPKPLADFYNSLGGAMLGDAYVFPLEDADRPARRYAIPGIVRVNRDFVGFAMLRGKTIWGRNQIYLFSADALGAICMHDMLTLQVLRKYVDFGVAMTDCLMVGKL